jgi:hypothetical protein
MTVRELRDLLKKAEDRGLEDAEVTYPVPVVFGNAYTAIEEVEVYHLGINLMDDEGEGTYEVRLG